MSEPFLSVEQTAQRLQLHPFTIRRQLQTGRLRGVKRGRVWRIPESALFESSPPQITPSEPKRSTPAAARRVPQGFGKFAHLKISSADVTRARRDEVEQENATHPAKSGSKTMRKSKGNEGE
jgi:excisionase family DNA binding protein